MSRAIDALVAKHVMELDRVEALDTADSWDYWHTVQHNEPADRDDIEIVPYYSTDIAAAWQVVEKTRVFSEHKLLLYPSDGGWTVGQFVPYDTGYYCHADTAPMVICLAALKAKGMVICLAALRAKGIDVD